VSALVDTKFVCGVRDVKPGGDESSGSLSTDDTCESATLLFLLGIFFNDGFADLGCPF